MDADLSHPPEAAEAFVSALQGDADFALGWAARGATLVGGCCETGPAHIAVLAERLRAAGFVIV